MTWLKKYFYAIVIGTKGILLTLAYAKGRSDAKSKRDTEDLETYHDTRKRIDQVARDSGGSDADWLRERGQRK